ncbi:hypothetical protein V3C99_017969 [Haemonchus contortus]|uniref:SIS domain-containing protein n=1 Tax=Haemonchus contortus TaxID=6289 RepID=A0A7I5EEK0_HAECO
MDDRQAYEVVAFVPSVAALPLRLHFELQRMTSDSGWSRGRPVDVWVTNSAMVARITIARTSLSFTGQGVIAARAATPGQLVIATSFKNAAVAKFADTLLQMTEYQQLPIVRIVIDPALREGAPVTTVDLHNMFQGILISFPDAFGPGVVESLSAYAHGRRLIERLLFYSEDLVHLIDGEREKFRLAEDENSEATENTRWGS